MQNERLQQLLRSKGSSYIPQNTQAVSPLNKQSQNSINQSNKYITNYAVQKIQNQSTHIAITSSSDRRTTPTPSRSSMNVMPQHSSSVSPIRLVQLSTERVQNPKKYTKCITLKDPFKQSMLKIWNTNTNSKSNNWNIWSINCRSRIKESKLMATSSNLHLLKALLKLMNQKNQQNLRILEDKQRTDIKQLKEELQQWKDRYGELQKQQSNQIGFNEELRQLKKSILQFEDENKDLQMHLRDKDQEILKLRSILNEKDDIIDQLNDQIQELQVFQENYSRVETTLVSLQGEVDVWRKKFKEKNEEASELSEKLIMAETSLEAMKKRQTTQVKEVNISKSNNHNIGITMTQSIDMPGRFSTNRGTHNSNKQQS